MILKIMLDKPYKQLERGISEIDKMRSISSDIVNASVGLFKNILNEANDYGECEIARKIQTAIEAIKNIENPGSYVDKKVAAIRNQSLILLITNFERFLNEFVIILIENYSHVIKWPENKSAIDFGMFKYGYPTLGEIVLRSFREKYTFQDLKSIIAFSKEILGISIELQKDDLEIIILNYAKRNALIHNSGVVDDKFQKQVRDLQCSALYSKGDIIEISEEEYLEAKKLFLDLARQISKKVEENLVPF